MNGSNESVKHDDFFTARLELLDAIDHEAEILDFNNSFFATLISLIIYAL